MTIAGTFSVGVVVAGCGPMLTASAGTGNPNSEARITSTPAPKSTGVDVHQPVVVKVDKGRLSAVSVRGDQGIIEGTISPDGSTWSSAGELELPFGATYEVSAVAVDAEGRPAELNDQFTTVEPQNIVKPGTRYVTDYAYYGVGMPLVVVPGGGAPVAPENRKAIESQLKLYTSVPVAGAWSWNADGSVVTFRPKEFWPAGTKIYLDAQLYGDKLNETTYAGQDLTLDYSIGDAVVSNVDVNTLQMTVTRNGAVERVIPVTIGKPGYETHSGIKVISGKEGTITMKSPPGDPEFYVAPNVQYSMRLTDHGEYFHAAPWAADAFGNYAYSHGCISMTTENAAAFYNGSLAGDVVTVFGTPLGTEKDNGITVWNESWPNWLAGSTLGEITVGPAPAAAPAPAAPAAPGT